MIDHLSGNHPEFHSTGDPVCNNRTMEVYVSNTVHLPVINCGFLDSGDSIEFSARGYPREQSDGVGEPPLVDVIHGGVYLDEDGWRGSTNVECDLTEHQWRHMGIEFITDLRVNGLPVVETRIPVRGSRGFPGSPCVFWDDIETVGQDPGWFVMRLTQWQVIGRSDREVRLVWDDLHAWYRQREVALTVPRLDTPRNQTADVSRTDSSQGTSEWSLPD